MRVIDLLETLFLAQRISAWSTNLSKRVVSRPKLALLDSGCGGVACQRIRRCRGLWMTSEIAGHLLEGFVADERSSS